MYYVEWMAWLLNIKSDQWFEENMGEAEDSKKSLMEPVYAESVTEDKARQAAKRFAYAETRGPVYACNDTYLEMRCGGMEDKRGLVTFISGAFVLLLFGMWVDFALPIYLALIRGNEPVFGRPLDIGDIFYAVFVTLISGTPLWFYFKYAFRFTRLEALTSRHLLIRFNRITRQVYLHRPPSCGGIVVVPWEGVSTEEIAGQRLLVGWFPGDTPLPFPVMAFVGKQSSSADDLKAEWEFIRRYMNEGGLQAIPKPRISSQLPLPWQAFIAQFEASGPFLHNGGPLIWLGCLMISPAFVIVGLSHWASLLLCWRPRWPKVLREAGLPGKPVPALSTADDYPPGVREQLLANEHRWAVRPGRRPERKGSARGTDRSIRGQP
ncbi:hypothetical protein ACKI2N_015345 [Cupriavidus sp. 30B13]|uniref:hypothetical protein n=1 Tax=Cupriavidus sp. 30B13 TaxID=3384241 RepID=UPI003B91440E